jgi:hypothetical protein
MWISCVTMTTNPKALTTDYMFGPSGGFVALMWPLLISATIADSIVLHGQTGRPPRVSVAASAPPPPHLLRHRLMAMGFALSRKLAPVPQPRMRFVFLGSEFCLGLPSDPTSRWTPLPSANSYRHQVL